MTTADVLLSSRITTTAVSPRVVEFAYVNIIPKSESKSAF